MEPRTEQIIASFVADNLHLRRIPGVDKSSDFICAVCSGPGRYAVKWLDPIQETEIKMGRDCDRYVRKIIGAAKAKQLQQKLEADVHELLAG